MNALLFGVAYLLILVGVVGAMLPIIPGAPLIWLGAFLWAWADKFDRVGWPTLIVLAVLAVLSWASDLVVTTVTSRKAGAGWRAVAGGIAGGVLGALLVGGIIPLLGSIVGTILGAVCGMIAVEYLLWRDWRKALRSAAGYVEGYLLATFLQLCICATMISIFAWQAFF